MRRLLFFLFLLSLFPFQCWAASVKLTWDYTQGATPATKFTMYRQLDCTGLFVAVASIPVTTLTYTDSTVVAGSTYCWDVTASAATGEESTPSNVVSFRVPFQVPAPPTNLRGTVMP